NDVARKLSYHPAQILKIPGGDLRAGGVADITIIDPKASWTVRVDRFKSRSLNSPFEGWKLHGRVKYTIVGGQISYSA
ncbi:MAG: amidohydrolase family protein, partial [candidate division Zixibacteria bacterium]|nr:amidohydrolase family protein [candidate division Zixibacteria bacterium]